MELNLCPSCSAFVNATWEICGACGGVLREASAPVAEAEPAYAPPVIEYVAEPVSESVVEPAEPVNVASGIEADSFTTGWASPGNSVELESLITPNTWTAPAEPTATAVNTTGGWSAPESGFQHTETPVQIAWPTPASVAASTEEPSSAPSFYSEPVANHLQADVELQTFHYDANALSSNAPTLDDGRLRPELGKGPIIGFAVAGIVAVLLPIVLIAFIGGAAKEDAVVGVVTPPLETTPTTITPAPPAATPANGWITYNDPEGRFTASLPAEPTVSSRAAADGPITTWTSRSASGQTSAVVYAAALPKGTDWRNNQQVLKSAVNAAAASSGMAIKGQITGTDGGTMHVDALLSNASGSSNIRFFVIENTLYGLSITGVDTAANGKAFDTLTKSFEPLAGKKV